MDGRCGQPIRPVGFDLEQPSVARVYDYFLGGSANWPVDRRFGDRVLARFPLVRSIAMANRDFLRRAVRHLARLGVRQFVDIGSGLPTMGSTHSVADELAADVSKVVYVDNDPVAVANSRTVIEKSGDPARHAVLLGDLRDPDRLWQRIGDAGLIDLTGPVGLLMIAVLHIRQPDGAGIDVGSRVVARYRELLSSGSYLAISHATKDGVPDEVGAALAEVGGLYQAHAKPSVWRTRREVSGLFGDFEILDPGVTWTPLWHPEETGPGSGVTFSTPSESVVLAGVARKP